MSTANHPCSEGWTFPDPMRTNAFANGVRRTNLRVLCARPGRFEHHLMVVARIGVAQLEVPTASEPLAFAHVNLSDEYVVVLPVGHAMFDSFPFRVFVSDAETGEDVLRINHKVLDLVLHPYGFSHWPGRVRPPYAALVPPPGMRRCGVTLVFCAGAITKPPEDRALWISPGLEDAAKLTSSTDVPRLVSRLSAEPSSRELAKVGEAKWELLIAPASVAPPRGGYLCVLDVEPGTDACPTDLVFIPKGATFEARGVKRALLMSSDTLDVEPPPASWDDVPSPPFAPLTSGPTASLPVSLGALSIEARDATFVRVALGEQHRDVPRYWLARTLFRVALHGYRLGYVETYEGFFVDDTDGSYHVGLRGVGKVTVSRSALQTFVEAAYRAVAPDGYSEDLVP